MEQRFLTKELIEQFIQHLVREEKSKATLEKYRRDLMTFLCFAGEEEISKHLSCRIVCRYLMATWKAATI